MEQPIPTATRSTPPYPIQASSNPKPLLEIKQGMEVESRPVPQVTGTRGELPFQFTLIVRHDGS